MASLQELVLKKQDIESMLIENEGELTAALERMWEDTSLEIKDKLDRYGHVIQQLEAAKTSVTEKKRARNTQYANLEKRIENEINSIKGRLNFLSGGERLEGNEVKFVPFNSKISDGINMALVPLDKSFYNLPKLTHNAFFYLQAALDTKTVKDLDAERELSMAFAHALESRSTTVTALGEDHPAITYKVRPSVRVYD